MGVDSCFEVSEDNRTGFIDNKIVPKLPENVRVSARERVTAIVNSYVGRDADALSVLVYAAERGRFDEFAERLEKFCVDHLGFVDPGARRLEGVAGAHRADAFFLQCYGALGIKSRESTTPGFP